MIHGFYSVEKTYYESKIDGIQSNSDRFFRKIKVRSNDDHYQEIAENKDNTNMKFAKSFNDERIPQVRQSNIGPIPLSYPRKRRQEC